MPDDDDLYRNRTGVTTVWLIGAVLLVYAMPKTLRRYSVLWYASAIVAYAAAGTAENRGDNLIDGYKWWGWFGIAGIAFALYLWPRVRHHIDWHSYQTRPGIFSATRESERFSWFPPFGTVHKHGCNAPPTTSMQDYREQAKRNTYGPEYRQPDEFQPMYVPGAEDFVHLPTAPQEAPKTVKRIVARQVVEEPLSEPQRPIRREDHGVFVINDYREFDPEAGE